MVGVEQANHGGEHRLARQLAALQVLFDPASKTRQLFAEGDQAFEFRLVPLFAESGVIAILLPASSIDAGGLKMPVGIGAEPGVLVGRRKTNGIQPVDLAAIGDAFPVRIKIGPGTADALARDAGFAVAAMPQHGAVRFTRLIARSKRSVSGRVPEGGPSAAD
jgi:hypothetical protein